MRGMRNSKRKTTYEKARDILAQGIYGVLSCHCDDGLPYGVPLSYALSGNALYFHCALQGQKLDNLAHDDRVCFTVVKALWPLGRPIWIMVRTSDGRRWSFSAVNMDRNAENGRGWMPPVPC